jgi:hypothetical protein
MTPTLKTHLVACLVMAAAGAAPLGAVLAANEARESAATHARRGAGRANALGAPVADTPASAETQFVRASAIVDITPEPERRRPPATPARRRVKRPENCWWHEMQTLASGRVRICDAR